MPPFNSSDASLEFSLHPEKEYLYLHLQLAVNMEYFLQIFEVLHNQTLGLQISLTA